MNSRRPLTLTLSLLLIILACSAETTAFARQEWEGETKNRGEIRFPRGSTATTVRGHAGPHVRDQYLIRARAGQVMTLSLHSSDPRMGFDVYVTTGLEALPVTAADELQTGWTGKLPAGDEYYINVLTRGGGGDYSFDVKIETTGGRKSSASVARESSTAAATNGAPPSGAGVAREFRPLLARLRRDAAAPILLPTELPAAVAGRQLYVDGTGDANGYTITLSSRPRCGANSCFVGFFSAERGATLTEGLARVALADGIEGAYKPRTCGGSCSPPQIEWEYEGTLYTIQLSVDSGSDERDRRTLTGLANSAIKAGPR